MNRKLVYGDRIIYNGLKGTIDSEVDCNTVWVQFDKCNPRSHVYAHLCRRLVKKKKPKREPMAVWIPCCASGPMGLAYSTKEICKETHINWKPVKFIEVIE